jgi:hypothetical protein
MHGKTHPHYLTERHCRRGSERSKGRTRKREAEIEWTYAPRIPPGEYQAISRKASQYFDKQFQRWVCAVQFDIVSDSLSMEAIAQLTWFMNLGRHPNPRAGRRSRYWVEWIRANGGPPKRGDRLSPRVFQGRAAIVRVEYTKKTHDRGPVESELAYSVVRDVIEWQTGGRVQ